MSLSLDCGPQLVETVWYFLAYHSSSEYYMKLVLTKYLLDHPTNRQWKSSSWGVHLRRHRTSIQKGKKKLKSKGDAEFRINRAGSRILLEEWRSDQEKAWVICPWLLASLNQLLFIHLCKGFPRSPEASGQVEGEGKHNSLTNTHSFPPSIPCQK